MKKIQTSFRKILTFTLSLIFILSNTLVNVHAAEPFETISSVTYVPDNLPNHILDSGMYEVIDSYSPVKESPYGDSKILKHLHSGVFIHGEMIRNSKNNEWLSYYDPELEQTAYIYSSHVTKHIHQFRGYCGNSDIPTGYCQCGYLYYAKDNEPYTIDLCALLIEILAGNWSSSQTFEGVALRVLLGMGVSMIPTFGPIIALAMATSDFSADIYYCATGDCDVIATVTDAAGVFTDLGDILDVSSSLRITKTLEITEPIGITNSFLSTLNDDSVQADFIGLNHDELHEFVHKPTYFSNEIPALP